MTPGQHVCLVCGYNMVGYLPDQCPFCGAVCDRFIPSDECSSRFRVLETPVAAGVNQLRSVPSLGLEHTAYRVETGSRSWWIDCPSSFDQRLPPAARITFTHHHFLGASNLYRQHFSCPIRLHERDTRHLLCRGFTFDEPFTADFEEDGIEAIHIDGHTPGFTAYRFREVLFVSDYVFWQDGTLIFNPYGPEDATRDGGHRLRRRLADRHLAMVCGYRHVVDYPTWRDAFDRLLAKG